MVPPRPRPARRRACGGFVNRENRVPYYQRLFQRHDGLRQWQKTSRSKAILLPYNIMLWGGFGASMYMMCRQVLGKKTWY
ncbi:Transcription factor c6 [Neofusicoccum parvum]|nr:Transcription factor c6 [Neofusicoccum parvum]